MNNMFYRWSAVEVHIMYTRACTYVHVKWICRSHSFIIKELRVCKCIQIIDRLFQSHNTCSFIQGTWESKSSEVSHNQIICIFLTNSFHFATVTLLCIGSFHLSLHFRYYKPISDWWMWAKESYLLHIAFNFGVVGYSS